MTGPLNLWAGSTQWRHRAALSHSHTHYGTKWGLWEKTPFVYLCVTCKCKHITFTITYL